MPVAAPRPCSVLGCRALSVAGGRCAEHPREPWRKKVIAAKRITGRRLQAWRKAKWVEHPRCAHCGALQELQGRWHLDHVRPLCEGGSDQLENMQVLCIPCHDTKSEAERLRAGRAA